MLQSAIDALVVNAERVVMRWHDSTHHIAWRTEAGAALRADAAASSNDGSHVSRAPGPACCKRCFCSYPKTACTVYAFQQCSA
jgi:hypothetical protein